MNLRRLRYFVAVAEERHFGHAARRLLVSQSPVSQQIRKLEAEVGVQLFERAAHGTELTEAGEALLPEARRVLELFGRLPAVVRTSEPSQTEVSARSSGTERQPAGGIPPPARPGRAR